jgi:microcompartment protein CcmK/EutM
MHKSVDNLSVAEVFVSRGSANDVLAHAPNALDNCVEGIIKGVRE